MIIDRSRTPGSLQPLGSFLFTGVAVKELTSPTSLRHWICQKHSHSGVKHKQNHVHSTHIWSHYQGLALNSEEAMMTETEFIHLLRR